MFVGVAVTSDWHETLLREMGCLFLTGILVGAHATKVSDADVFLICVVESLEKGVCVPCETRLDEGGKWSLLREVRRQ